MLIGASYYSECWPRERYPIDARLMAEAGLNVARMGEFAWSRFQPTPTAYHFDWMDDCIGQLKAQGIRTLLGTPTRVAPPWLVAQDRSMLIVNGDGSRAAYGGRYEFCLNNPTFRTAAAGLVRTMAEHYQSEDGLIGWHLDNEYGVGICYCERCAGEFQRWLQKRYGALPTLNARWGTVYWSTEYTSWDQISTPQRTENRQNPAVYLDYRRFFSDVTIGFAQMAADLIRATGDPRPIMTNPHSSIEPHNLDYADLAKIQDIAATNNNFPHAQSGQMNLDLVYGLKRKPFWSVEQRVSGGGVPVMTPISRPGDVRRWTYLTIGHGANAIIYWGWRRYTLGQEQYWGGILEHDAKPGRFYAEVRAIAEEIARIGPILDETEAHPDVGILNSYDSRWALDVELNHPDLSFERLAHSFWEPLRKRGLTAEFSRPDADLSRYRLVIAPTLLLINEAIVTNLQQYVANGGTLVLTVRCGVKDWNNKIAEDHLLQSWRALTGVRIAEFTPLTADPAGPIGQLQSNYETVQISAQPDQAPLQMIRPEGGFLSGETYPVRTWMEILEPETDLEVLARYGQDYCAGLPSIVRHRLGRGQVITLGTILQSPGQNALIDWLLTEVGIHPPIETPPGIEVLIRRGPTRDVVILLNENLTIGEVTLPSPMEDLLDGGQVQQRVEVPARGVRVLGSLAHTI